MGKRIVITFAIAMCIACFGTAFGAVVADYLGDDTAVLGNSIQGNWVGNVGAEGYHLLFWGQTENQKSYPSFITEAQPVNLAKYQWSGPGTTDDVRAVESADGSQRAATCWVCANTSYIHIPVAETTTFRLGLYMLDWDGNGPRSSKISVCDASEEAAPPWTINVDNYYDGQWLFVRIAADAGDTISIKLENITAGSNTIASMLAFDAPDVISVANTSNGSARFTNQQEINVTWHTEAFDVAGYQLSETDTEPTTWLPAAPATFTLGADEGVHTVYGWIKTTTDQIFSSSVDITYSTLAPVVSVEDISVEIADGVPAVVYPTDVDTGSYDPAGGNLLYDAQYYFITCDPDDQTPDQPYVTLDASAETQYLAALTVTNEAGTTASMPFAINIVAGAEPTSEPVVWDGDGGLGNQQWTRGMNWDLDQAPANPTTASVTFTEAGSVAADDASTTNIMLAGAAKAVTANAEPFNIGASDTLGITVDGGAPELVLFTAADLSAATAQEVADSMNEFAIGYSASATAEGKVEIVADGTTASSLVFSNLSGTPAETLGLPLDTPVVPEWKIGKLIVGKTDFSVDDFSHTTDLSGGKLTINGPIVLAEYGGSPGDWGSVYYTIKNGTVQIGTPEARHNIAIANSWAENSGATLKIAPGTTFIPYIANMNIGGHTYTAGDPSNFDIRGVQIPGGTMSITGNLYVGWDYSGTSASFMIDDSSNLKTLDVGGILKLGSAGGDTEHGIPSFYYIGDPDNGYMLPSDFNIKVGDSQSDTRGDLYVGYSGYGGELEGILKASSGGSFDAYVNKMEIGTRDYDAGYYATGTLDLSKTNSTTINANSVRIGVSMNTSNGGAIGKVYLPSGASLTAGTVKMGDVCNGSQALLDLPDADLTVDQSLTMTDNSKITVHVQGASCGIDLAAAATLSVTSSGLIEIDFEQDQNAGDTGTYYGLRWAGNHKSYLKQLMDSGNIVVNNSTSKPVVTASYDDTADATYITVVDTLPLQAIAKDITVEVSADDPTAIINAQDIDSGSFDPNGFTIVDYIITSAGDQTVDQPYVTLNGLGDHTVTLLIKNDNSPVDVATTECTVTLYATPAPTANSVTWSGGASSSGMNRPEWTWGSNWLGGLAPANPTTATITFRDLGMGTSKLSGSRATIIGSRTEPFLLYDADQIAISANGTLTTYTFSVDALTGQGMDITSLTAQNVADIFNATATGFQAQAIDGKIVLMSDAGADSILQVNNVDSQNDVAARLGLPTDPSSAQRVVGTIEIISPTNSGVDVDHTIDLNGLNLTITKELDAGSTYNDSWADHLTANVTFINGNLILGSPDTPANLKVGCPGYGDKSTDIITIGENTTLEAYLGDVTIGAAYATADANGTLDLRQTTIVGGTLKMQNLTIGDGTRGSSLVIGPDTLDTIEVAGDLHMGDAIYNGWCDLAYIGDPDNGQMLPPNTSLKIGSVLARGNLVMSSSTYNATTSKIVASSGGTFDANVQDMTVGEYTQTVGWTYKGTLDVSAMNSCSIDAVNINIGVGTGANGHLFGTIALPAGTATVDTLTMGAPNFAADSAALLQLNGTQFAVSSAANLKEHATVDVQLDGTSSGLDLDALATLTVDDGAAINVTFAAASTSDPYYGIRWAGDHQTELQALIDAGKITADTTAVGADAVVFADADFTYFGIQSAAPTWPIEGDANMDCKVNIIDLIFVRNRLNKDVTTGDNWQADVNNDGKVNIIDLIYVRNRLNNKCAQ